MYTTHEIKRRFGRDVLNILHAVNAEHKEIILSW